MNYLKDTKFNCHSIILNMSLKKYIELTQEAFENNGGISGQRTTLTTKSAKQIREQMIKDFKAGAVLPPVVIGIVDNNCQLSVSSSESDFDNYLESVDKSSISIIDGMQRTTAMLDSGLDEEQKNERKIRVEFWIVSDINSLIYRMLVLNTGQIPWNIRRQLEVVFSPIKKIIHEKIPKLNLIEVDESGRRTQPGEFQADKIIQLLNIFTSRSESFDPKEVLTDNFQRLDMIESISKKDVFDMFVHILKLIVQLDIILSKCPRNNLPTGRFKQGLDLFTTQPAMVGFVTALAQRILGRPGSDYDSEQITTNYQEICESFKSLNQMLEQKSEDEICSFLDFELLNEKVESLKGTRVGDIERDYYLKAFRVLIDEKFSVNTLSVCWRNA